MGVRGRGEAEGGGWHESHRSHENSDWKLDVLTEAPKEPRLAANPHF